MLVNGIAQIAPLDVGSKQALLEATDIAGRADLLVQFMQFQRMVCRAAPTARRRCNDARSGAARKAGLPGDADAAALRRGAAGAGLGRGGLAYPVRDGVPVLLIEKARRLEEESDDGG
jgi:hypothetical protein